MMAVGFDATNGVPEGVPRALFPTQLRPEIRVSRPYAVAKNGDRFLLPIFADALARTAAEGHEGEARQALLQTVEPALWPKRLRLGKERRVAMHHPWAHPQLRPAVDDVPIELSVARCLAG